MADHDPVLGGLSADGTKKEADCFEAGEDDFDEGPAMESKPTDADPAIVETKIDVSKSFKRFQKHIVDATSVDFSGGILGSRKFFIDRPEYSLAGAGEDESLEQKYNRLKQEVASFMEELDAAQKAQTSDTAEDNTAVASMATEMKFLSQQLQQAKIDQLVGAGADGVAASHQEELSKRLMGNLQEVQKTKGAAADGAKASGDEVVYELYYRPEEAKFSQVSKAGRLEERIAKLEKALGAESLAPVAAELQRQDLSVHGALSILTDRVSALTAENTTDMTTRLKAVEEQAAKTKAALAAQPGADKSAEIEDYAEKVNEMYEIGKKWDSVATAVPDVIKRLKALKALHEQGSNFGRTLTQLEAAQQQMKSTITDETEMLSKAETSLATNMKKIEGNFKAVDERIEALNKNITKLS